MQEYIAQAFLLGCAVLIVRLGARRFRAQLLKGRFEEDMKTSDAMRMPLTGSLVLFSLYLIYRYVSKTLLNLVIAFHLSLMSVFMLADFIRPYIRPRIVTGVFCVAMATWYFVTRHWVANDVLAFAIAVVAIESIPVSSFATSFVLLVGLFLYDIFWVFGTDVMLTVATGIDGPIKLIFPRTLFGPHEKKSLLGLGDIIVPGLFLSQTLVFSRDYVRRGELYFRVALVAYTLSLVQTMAVMIIYKHGQPALLYIVPWLLITFSLVALCKGDAAAAWRFDVLKNVPHKRAHKKRAVTGKPPHEEDGGSTTQRSGKKAAMTSKAADGDEEGASWLAMLYESVLQLFGFHLDEEDEALRRKPRRPAPRKGSAKQTLPVIAIDRTEA